MHLEPGTIEFNRFTPAEYLEECNARKMKWQSKSSSRRIKGGMQTPLSTMTLNFSYIYTLMMKAKGIYKSLRD